MAITKSGMANDHSADFSKGLGDVSMTVSEDSTQTAPQYPAGQPLPQTAFDYPGNRT